MPDKEELTKQALTKLAEAATHDEEWAHAEADDTLCELLLALGYAEVVKAFTKITNALPDFKEH